MRPAAPYRRNERAMAGERMAVNPVRVLAALLPALLGALLVVVANLPVSLAGGLVPAPLLAFMPVYFWTLVRPDLMPPAAAFAIGLFEDLLSGGPPGVWGASFLVAYALLDRHRDAFAGLSGAGAILGFGAALMLAAGTAYVIVSIYYFRLPPVGPLFLQAVMTVVFFVPVAVMLGWIHRRFVGPMRSDV